MNILGISALYHDSAATLVIDGEIVAAAQEERFSRKKHDARIPQNAIKYCLKEGKILSHELDYVIFYDDSLLTLDRFLSNAKNIPDAEELLKNNFDKMFSNKLWVYELLKKEIPSLGEKTKFYVTKHHISHAASAFYPSPYKKSIIITLDGVGEWTTLAIGVGNGEKITLREELRYPNSLGLFYSAFTYFCGFKVNEGDYKFMGLAPYGTPRFYNKICNNIIDIKDDGSFKLNMDFFDFQNGRTMINEEQMALLFEGKKRIPESPITKREMDIAASVQLVTEEIILKLARHAKEQYGADIDNLVLAGGVALNCVANGKLLNSNIFKNIWIQPAAGDAGGALGAALYGYYMIANGKRNADEVYDQQKGSYLGPQYSDEEIEKFLNLNEYSYNYYENNLGNVLAEYLEAQKIVGLFQGRMEFGPRALGNRSIIADPRSKEMQSRMNLKIKFRESFRPFAPSVLREDVSEYFELNSDSPYMLICEKVQEKRRETFDLEQLLENSNMDMLPVVNTKRSDIPAVTHVDYSARIQTVDGRFNPKYYDIIKCFKERTGCGVIVNTSFNLRGEPIVCSLEDAYKCFMRSDMDILVLNNYVLRKEEQPEFKEEIDWRDEYELD